jgi:hypothetical protein
MAKPTKHAPIICTIVTILAVIGIVISFVVGSAIPAIVFLLPTAVYEMYRTEGASTKASSIIILIVLFLELVLLIFNIDFDIAEFLGQESRYIAGYQIPLGSLTAVGPTLIAVLSIVLFVRTRGKFTRWLAVNIFVTCFVILYLLDPETMGELTKIAVDAVLGRISRL